MVNHLKHHKKIILPKAYFGIAGHLVDWRKVATEIDPDDEELIQTPADVIKILGFDPNHLRHDG